MEPWKYINSRRFFKIKIGIERVNYELDSGIHACICFRFIVPVSMIVCNDVMAYVFGFFFGRTPLIQLSPKKTWEGFIGGGVATVIFGLVVSENLKIFIRNNKTLCCITIKNAVIVLIIHEGGF